MPGPYGRAAPRPSVVGRAHVWRRPDLRGAACLGSGRAAFALTPGAPAGITTYSILGADHGYRLLWVLTLSTAALVLFHELGARMGVVTGQGMAGLIRERYGVRWAAAALVALVGANVGTTCAEFAGIAAAGELVGVSRY